MWKGFFWDGFAFASILHSLNPLRRLIHIFEPQDEKKVQKLPSRLLRDAKLFICPARKRTNLLPLWQLNLSPTIPKSMQF